MDVISRVPQPPLTPNPLFWKFLPKNRKNRNPSPALPLGMEHWKWKGESLLYIVLLSMPLYVTAKVVWHFVSLHVWHFVSCKIMYDTLHHFMSFIENRGVWHKSVWHKKCDRLSYATYDLNMVSGYMICATENVPMRLQTVLFFWTDLCHSSQVGRSGVDRESSSDARGSGFEPRPLRLKKYHFFTETLEVPIMGRVKQKKNVPQ